MSRILVVEDDADLRQRVHQLLTLDGHNVVSAGDGKTTFELLDENNFDLLVIDWDLPDTNALEICGRYRQLGGDGAVLVLTGRTDTTDKVAAFREGADDYLTKPFAPAELSARVKALTRRSANRNDNEEHLEEMIGKTFADKYQIVSVLGKGGMGVVYKARHNALVRLCAIKVMLKSKGLQGGALKRFEQEARAMSLLNHPNLVGILDYGTSMRGNPYIVMEYVAGGTLQQEIDELSDGMALERALPIFLQTVDALAHAHEKGLIHRDLKPSNIMLIKSAQEDIVKIVDLGLVKFSTQMEDIKQGLTFEGEIFGSPYYMSPEQAASSDSLDHRTDIYSLGCLMYQTLTGEIPLAGANILETISKRLSQAPPAIRSKYPAKNFPKKLEQILIKSMAREREDRHSTMTELKEELSTLIQTKESKPHGLIGTWQGLFKKKP